MGKYAIFLVLALTFSMLTYSYALRNSIFLSNHRNVQSFSYNQAHNIAHGAALLVINSIKSSDGTFEPAEGTTMSYPGLDSFEKWQDMEGSYRITVQSLTTMGGASAFPKDSLIIDTIGKFEENEYTIRTGVVRNYEWNPEIDWAVHAEKEFELGGSDFIQGDVTVNTTNTNAVKLGSQTKEKVDGNLFIGPGGSKDDVVNGNHQNVGGDIFNLAREQSYTMPVFPEFPTGYLTGGSVYGSQTITPADYDGYFLPEIDLGGNSTLTIDTGGEDRVLYAGKFNVQSSNVEITGGGKVTMYVDTHLDLKGRATVNENGDPEQLMVFYKGNQEVDLYDETLDFSGNTFFNGSLYADKANIKLTGTTGIQGNIITGGPNVDLSGNAGAISRLIFAPNATVRANGNVSVKGSIIADKFIGSGNTSVIYEKDLDSSLPELWLSEPETSVVWWN